MASRECVVETLAFLGSAFAAKFPTPTETDMAVWHTLLDGVDDDAVRAACRAWCESDTPWPPTPGQLRTAATGARRYADRSHRPFDSINATGANVVKIDAALRAARKELGS